MKSVVLQRTGFSAALLALVCLIPNTVSRSHADFEEHVTFADLVRGAGFICMIRVEEVGRPFSGDEAPPISFALCEVVESLKGDFSTRLQPLSWGGKLIVQFFDSTHFPRLENGSQYLIFFEIGEHNKVPSLSSEQSVYRVAGSKVRTPRDAAGLPESCEAVGFDFPVSGEVSLDRFKNAIKLILEQDKHSGSDE